MASELVDEALLDTLRRQFEGLKRSPDGELLYKLIARGLKRFGDGEARIEHAFIGFLHGLLGRYIADPQANAAVRIKARVIQQRLAFYRDDVGAQATAPEPIAAVLHESPAPSTDDPPPAETAVTASSVSEAQATLAHALTQSIAGDIDPQRLSTVPAAGDMMAFDDLKALFMRGLDELIRSRQDLQQKLTSTAEYLKAVQHDREQLQQELMSAKRHGVVDALTGLPGRDVFVRALGAEIGRVKRYGFAVAVALMELDGIAAISERHGRNASDAILRCYARDIFSRFRAYDLVARYGDATFAVLFPNTQQDGALRALDKARQAAASSVLTLNGRTVPLPGFTSALTLYTPGEQPAALLERADQALAAARHAGGGRTITALSAG